MTSINKVVDPTRNKHANKESTRSGTKDSVMHGNVFINCCTFKHVRGILWLHKFNNIAIQQDCNSANNLAWTNNNALSCSDNKACTKNDRCSNGVCSGTPFTCLPCEECYNDACRVKPGYCVINDGGTRKCFNHGAIRPGYPCQVK